MLAVASTVWIVTGWLAPWRHRVIQAERERELAGALVRAWGVDTLAPFVLRADKSYFFTADEAAFLAYRVVGGVAIVSGDPVGPPDRGPRARRALRRTCPFVRLADRDPRRVRTLAPGLRSARPACALPRRRGDRRHGDLLARGARRSERSVSRCTDSATPAIPHGRCDRARFRPACARSSESIADEWRGDQPERGFAMALDTLFALDDEHAVFLVGFAPDESPAGFLHFALSPASRSLSLSSMPRLRSTPTASTSG